MECRPDSKPDKYGEISHVYRHRSYHIANKLCHQFAKKYKMKFDRLLEYPHSRDPVVQRRNREALMNDVIEYIFELPEEAADDLITILSFVCCMEREDITRADVNVLVEITARETWRYVNEPVMLDKTFTRITDLCQMMRTIYIQKPSDRGLSFDKFVKLILDGNSLFDAEGDPECEREATMIFASTDIRYRRVPYVTRPMFYEHSDLERDLVLMGKTGMYVSFWVDGKCARSWHNAEEATRMMNGKYDLSEQIRTHIINVLSGNIEKISKKDGRAGQQCSVCGMTTIKPVLLMNDGMCDRCGAFGAASPSGCPRAVI